uniref:Ig-like domain-containing protein n=1 Tax=Sciurus vulgaris TaxID=55149 RepID=A0A8D2B834_SCIVU
MGQGDVGSPVKTLVPSQWGLQLGTKRQSGTPGPSVFPLQSCCKSATSVTLGCLVMGYFPEPVTVTWDTGSLNASTLNFPTTQLSSGLLARTSQVTVSGTGEWARKSFTCSVGHAPSTHQKCPGVGLMLPLPSPPTDHEPRGISTYLIPPSPLDLYVRTAPKLTCLVVDLESKEGVEVVWTRDSQKPVSPDPWKATKQPNATFSITSTLPVDAKDWIDGETYRCMVKHPELPKPIIRTLAKAPGRSRIQVHVFLPPEEPGSQDKLTLTCLVQNFFPMDISVQWLRNGQVHRDQQSTTAPLRTHTAHPAFFLFSRLEVARADWAPGNTFTCRVVHEALPGRRTLEETVSRSPELDLQELCAEEAESAELDELWSSTCVFVSLFLLSLSYGATITLVKVGCWRQLPCGLPGPQSIHPERTPAGQSHPCPQPSRTPLSWLSSAARLARAA